MIWGEFTQEIPDAPTSRWQVAYDEEILNAEGDAIVADGFFDRDKVDLWEGDIRIAFFFHFLDLARPLQTPFGDVALSPETPLPSRLLIMKYEQPD